MSRTLTGIAEWLNDWFPLKGTETRSLSDVVSAINTALGNKIDSAGTGLSKSGTTLNHSNNISAQSSTVFKKFKYDGQGHITGIADVESNDLPQHGHSTDLIADTTAQGYSNIGTNAPATQQTINTAIDTALGTLPVSTAVTNWTEISYVSGYKGYGTSGDTVRYRRVGNVVELVGRWTPSSNKSASDDDVQFGSIPASFAPSYPVRLRMQGSGLKTYLLSVSITGKLSWARYGTTSSTTLLAGDWFNVQAVWTIT